MFHLKVQNKQTYFCWIHAIDCHFKEYAILKQGFCPKICFCRVISVRLDFKALFKVFADMNFLISTSNFVSSNIFKLCTCRKLVDFSIQIRLCTHLSKRCHFTNVDVKENENVSAEEDSFLQSVYNGVLIDMCPKKAHAIWNEMALNNIPHNTHAYNAMIKAHLRQNNLKSAYDMLLEMEESGIQPNKQTFVLLIEEMLNFGSLQRIAQNLIHLATSPRYGIGWDADFALFDALSVARCRESAIFLQAYRRIYTFLPAGTDSICSTFIERLLACTSQDRSLHQAFCIVWKDSKKRNHHLSIRAVFNLIENLARTSFEQPSVVRELFESVKPLEIDDGLLKLLLVYALRNERKTFSESLLLKLHDNAQKFGTENTVPPWIASSVMQLSDGTQLCAQELKTEAPNEPK